MFSLSSLQTRNDQNVITNMAEIEQWNQKDVTARNYIFATLAKPMKENLYSCESAAAMWTKLDTYTVQTQGSRELTSTLAKLL